MGIEPGKIEADILKAIKESGLNCNRWHLRRDSKRFAFCKKLSVQTSKSPLILQTNTGTREA